MKKAFLLLALIFSINSSFAQLKVTFPSKDGLTITADWYPVSTNLPTIILCHQNKFSRGEYTETALRLNKFGFNCMAVDLRVGESCNNVVNETAAAAKAKKQTPNFNDAEQDIIAAVEFVYSKNQKPVILMGSSYSASLSLKIAAENNKVGAVIVFSPGEYFDDKTFVGSHIKKLICPVFATSSKEESAGVTDLLKDVNARLKIQYIPVSAGDHGSKVLWPQAKGNQEYWIALMSFLDKIKRNYNQ